MKKPSDQLFRLINAMTPAEKRYFKMNLTDGKSAISIVFDAINKQSSYNEQQLKGQLPPNITKHLKVYKVQLQQALLKSLQLSTRHKQIYAQIRQGLEEVDILFDKQLYDMASDRLQKVKRLCLKHEAFTYLIEICTKSFYIRHISIDGKGISKHPLFQEIDHFVKQLSTHYEFSFLSQVMMEKARAVNYTISSEEERLYLEELLKSDLLTIPESTLPFQTRVSRNSILTFIYALLKQPEKEYKVRKANVDLYENNPHFKQSMPLNYMGVLRNYLNYCSAHQLKEEVNHLMETAEGFTRKNKKMGVHLIHFYYAKLSLWFNQGYFKYMLEHLEGKICQHLDQYQIQNERIAFLNYVYLALSHLALGQHQNVQHYVRLMGTCIDRLNHHEARFAQMIELVNHYEAGDEDTTLRRLQSFLRKEPPAKESPTFFHRILLLFKTILKAPEKTREEAATVIEAIPSFKKDPNYLIWENHLLLNWLDAIAQNQRLKTYLERKYRHSIRREPS
jgi:hypothetical protein